MNSKASERDFMKENYESKLLKSVSCEGLLTGGGGGGGGGEYLTYMSQ